MVVKVAPMTKRELTKNRLAVQVLHRLQDAAWARGDTPMNAAQFRAYRYHRDDEPARDDCDLFDEDEAVRPVPGSDVTPDTPGYSGLIPGPGVATNTARRSRRDPTRVNRLIKALVRKKGWSDNIMAAEVIDLWPQAVGEQIASHTTAEKFDNGTLTIRAQSTAWAQTLRYSLPQIMKACDQTMPVRVDKVLIYGPKAPSWKHGPRSVPGRGPRDTYG